MHYSIKLTLFQNILYIVLIHKTAWTYKITYGALSIIYTSAMVLIKERKNYFVIWHWNKKENFSFGLSSLCFILVTIVHSRITIYMYMYTYDFLWTPGRASHIKIIPLWTHIYVCILENNWVWQYVACVSAEHAVFYTSTRKGVGLKNYFNCNRDNMPSLRVITVAVAFEVQRMPAVEVN